MEEIKRILEEFSSQALKGLRMIWTKVNTPEYRTPSLDFYLPTGGQFQFTVGAPQYDDPRRKDGAPSTHPGFCVPVRDGAVYCEAAPPDPNFPPTKTSQGRLDWANRKIVFALGDKDIGEILAFARMGKDEVRLVHKPESSPVTKTFSIKKGVEDPKWGPQWRMELTEVEDGTKEPKSKVSVYMKAADMQRLLTFLECSFPFIFGMNKV